jgi:hypothetical protein
MKQNHEDAMEIMKKNHDDAMKILNEIVVLQKDTHTLQQNI